MANDATRASLELLYNISRELATTLDLHAVLRRVLFLSIHNVGAERGTLIVLDDREQPIDAAIVYKEQLLPHTTDRLKDTLDQGLAGWVMRNRQAVLLPDTSLDERWLRRADDSAEQSGSKSAICLPLESRDDLVGILTIVHPNPGFFNEDHLALLQAIADQASIAIYNARLYDSLESATRRYHELFDDSIDPILIINFEGQILEANRQAEYVTGYSQENLGGMLVSNLIELRLDLLGEKYENLRGKRSVTYETDLRKKNQETLPVEVHVRDVQIGAENSVQWTLRDISERKALDSLQEDLMAMIYHDLRSPLANIVSSLDMLSSLIPMNELPSLKSIFSIANRSTERLQRLINSLLDINRLESGQSITNRSPVGVEDLIHESLDAVKPVVEGKQQHVNVDLPKDFPMLWVDSDMIRRVLINLVENATKFTPVNGKITIGGKEQGDWVLLWVEDSGPGIPAEAQEHIFNKFIRLQTERYPRGVGLGLAFCRLAVQAHGGNIWVESQEGAGSRFQFTLPSARKA